MNKRTMFGILLCLALVAGVIADTETTTVTYVIPSQVDHSISYGGSCSSANFYYVESDANLDGTQTGINVTSDSAGANFCQNNTVDAMTLNNIGSVAINISANFTAALPSGIVMKVSQNFSGYQASCQRTIVEGANLTACANVSFTNATLLVENLAAQTGTQETYWFADMSNFNSGVATTGVTRTLQTIATDNS